MLPKADTLYSNPIRESPPCKDCPERHIACHDKCERYKAWKDEIGRVNGERKKYKDLPQIKMY